MAGDKNTKTDTTKNNFAEDMEGAEDDWRIDTWNERTRQRKPV